MDSETQVGKGVGPIRAFLLMLFLGSPVTCLLSLVIVVVFAFCNGDEAVVRFGSSWGSLAQGDWWRLFTSVFVHNDLDHLFYNVLSLCVVGSLLEWGMGSLTFLAVFLISGALGSFVECQLVSQGTFLGASGAILGIAGAAVVFLVAALKQLSQLPEVSSLKDRREMLGIVGRTSAVVFGTGFANVLLDLHGGQGSFVGHACGFLAGMAAYALVLFLRQPPEAFSEGLMFRGCYSEGPVPMVGEAQAEDVLSFELCGNRFRLPTTWEDIARVCNFEPPAPPENTLKAHGKYAYTHGSPLEGVALTLSNPESEPSDISDCVVIGVTACFPDAANAGFVAPGGLGSGCTLAEAKATYGTSQTLRLFAEDKNRHVVVVRDRETEEGIACIVYQAEKSYGTVDLISVELLEGRIDSRG